MIGAPSASPFVIDDGLATHLPAGLRPWDLVPPGSVAFSPTGNAPAEPVWRISLAPGQGEAIHQLASAERAMDQVAAALPLGERRLRTMAGPVSFAAGTPLSPPEAALRAALAGIATGSPPDAVSFGLADRLPPAWERANAAFRAALEHLQRLVTGRSWVETSHESRLLARTMLGRAGTRATAWREGIPAAEAALHARAVELAQRSAMTLARTINLAIRGATLLATLASGPVGMALALPAVWAFFDDVIAEVSGANTGVATPTRSNDA